MKVYRLSQILHRAAIFCKKIAASKVETQDISKGNKALFFRRILTKVTANTVYLIISSIPQIFKDFGFALGEFYARVTLECPLV